MMKEFEVRLKDLKTKIELLSADYEKRASLIEEYNDYLDELFPIIKKPLPEECELEESLMLEWYKKHKEYFKENGPSTFEKFIHKVDIVAEVKVKKVKKWGQLIHTEVIKTYKGEISSLFVFEASLSWNPQNWFKKGETCLILLRSNRIAFGRSNKMEIITDNIQKYVVCYEHEQEYWGDAKITVVSGFHTIPYDDAIRKILRCVE